MAEKSDVFVFFGATGDLARKKIYPALYHLFRKGRVDLPIIGVASRPWSLEQVRTYALESIAAGVKDPAKTTRSTSRGRSPATSSTASTAAEGKPWACRVRRAASSVNSRL